MLPNKIIVSNQKDCKIRMDQTFDQLISSKCCQFKPNLLGLVEFWAMFLAHPSGLQDEPEKRFSCDRPQLRRKKHVHGFRRTQHHWPCPIYTRCMLVPPKSTTSCMLWKSMRLFSALFCNIECDVFANRNLCTTMHDVTLLLF